MRNVVLMMYMGGGIEGGEEGERIGMEVGEGRKREEKEGG